MDQLLNVSGVTLSGALDFELNTTSNTFTDAGGELGANTRRLTGTDLAFSVLGQTLAGDFVFEEVVDSGGESQVKVSVSGLTVTLGGDTAGLALSEGSGLLLLTSSGLAASLSSEVEVLGDDALYIEGELTLEINTTGFEVDELFSVGLGAEESCFRQDLTSAHWQ